MRGGYQIVDLSTAVVGSETIVKDVYQTIKHFDGKPVFIITPNTSGVFAEFTESSGMYIGAYIGSNSHLFTVSIISSNRVTITDKGPAGGGGTSNYNELSNKPAIAGTTLSGDKSLIDLGIQGCLTEGANITIEDNEISANVTAASVSYDNTTSGMTADNVQEAITELNSKINNYSSTEHVVGTWIDSSTIYEKTGTFTPTDWSNTDAGKAFEVRLETLPNSYRVIYYELLATWGNNDIGRINTNYTYTTISTATIVQNVNMYIEDNNVVKLNVLHSAPSTFNNHPMYYTLRYTKS